MATVPLPWGWRTTGLRAAVCWAAASSRREASRPGSISAGEAGVAGDGDAGCAAVKRPSRARTRKARWGFMQGLSGGAKAERSHALDLAGGMRTIAGLHQRGGLEVIFAGALERRAV